MKVSKILTLFFLIFITFALILSCSKSEDKDTEIPEGNYIKLTIDGEEIMMTHLAVMAEKENKTWNLNALSGGSGSYSLTGRTSMTINIRDKDGILKEKTYKLDDGSADIMATFTEYLNEKPDTYSWSATTASALSGDELTVTFSSLKNGVAKGTFSGQLRVASGGDLKTFRQVTQGEFSLSMK
ncbi:hypothetical protein [Sphingobacterium ginsenosidimutans]|uniref:Lipocalin-like domain-containing protein n=1 Tax=Sphingobacterium ginsenosidimutans TaxID=687845 RepID=A0ABP7ZTA2_9SPHI